MKYVHAECLEKWFSSSQNPQSCFQCDQCKYRYHFRRNTLANFLSSAFALHLLTILVFSLLVVVFGYGVKLALLLLDSEAPLFDSFFSIDFNHIFHGIVGIGLSGFMSLLASFRILPHFWTLRGGAGGGGARSQVEMVVLVIVVLIGVARSVYEIYQIVHIFSLRALTKAGQVIENVNESV